LNLHLRENFAVTSGAVAFGKWICNWNTNTGSLSTSVSIVTRPMWFNSLQGQWWNFLFTTTVSRPALGPTQPPIQVVPGALTPGVRLTSHIHLVPRLRMRGAVPALPHTSLRWGPYASSISSDLSNILYAFPSANHRHGTRFIMFGSLV